MSPRWGRMARPSEVFGLTPARGGSRIPGLSPSSDPGAPAGRERERFVVMASALKSEELASYLRVLQTLRSRLRGDLDQMTDEALGRDVAGGTGNLSNVPLTHGRSGDGQL